MRFFSKSKQNFRNFCNCKNRLRYDREKALQSVTILSHRSNLGSNSYPSDGPRGRRCAPRGAWSAGGSSAGAGRAHVLRDLLRHTLGCPVRLGTPLDIRVHGALDLREDQISTVDCLLSARPSRPRPGAELRSSRGRCAVLAVLAILALLAICSGIPSRVRCASTTPLDF